MLRSVFFTLGSLALTSTAALAQTAPSDTARENVARAAASEIDERTASVVGSDAQSIRPSFEFLASSDASSVKISAGRQLSSVLQENGTLVASTLTFTLSGPLDKNNTLSNIATLDGLANSTSLAVSYRRTIAPGFNMMAGRDPATLLQAARRACADRATTADQRTACADWVGDPSAYLSEQQINDLGFNPVANPEAPTFLYGFDARVGHESFDIMDPLTFQKESDDRTPFSASVFFAYAPSIRPLLFLVGAQYQHRYKAANAQTLCEPPGPGGIQNCHIGSIADPVEQEATVLYAEARSQFNTGLVDWPIAIQARIAYDTSDEVTGVDVPVFLVRDSDNNLRGGLRFGWRSDTEDVTAGVFVGAAFSLF